MKKSGFYTRGFTTFALTVAFLTITVTGVILFVTPRGRVAHWTNWAVMGLGKEQWGAIHITAAIFFLVVAGLHLFFNWKVLLGYIRLKRVSGFRLKREFGAAIALSAFVVLGTLEQVPPFSNVLVLHEDIKNSWERPSFQPPVPHAEELRLEELAQQLNQPVETAIAALDEQGFNGVSPSAEILQIAETNAVAPSAVYQAMTNHADREGFESGGTRRFGRMTLGELCSLEALGLEAVIEALSERGVKAEETSPLRELAAALNMRPGQLASMISASIDGVVVQPGSFSCASSVDRANSAR